MAGSSAEARRVAGAFASAMLPSSRLLPAGGEHTAARAERLLASPAAARAFGTALAALDRAALPATGRRFSRLPPEAQARLVAEWERGGLGRLVLFALGSVLRCAHYDDPDFYRALGASRPMPVRPEAKRWHAQVRRAEEASDIECDVVVVGTGAGGAAAAYELAVRGHAVVMLEEGELHERDVFDGRSFDAYRKFYRTTEGLVAVGNTAIPILVGRMVGGSTALNGGTCVRGVSRALDRWAEAVGSEELSAAGLAPYYERVERMLGVGPTRSPYQGPLTRIVEQGCASLGWRSSLVPRNAPDCDGQGLCTFGCPTDAKRSTNVSYVPAALERGALLFTGVRAERVLIERGRAVGVAARAGGRALRLRARAVVLACGPLHTPDLLLAQGLANPHVGRHLKLHPTTMISGLFPEVLRAYGAVPQAVSCDEFREEGLLLYGAAAPPDAGALNFAFSGPRLVEVMDAYDRVATLTLIVIDESEGRVRRVGGRRLISYSVSRRDAQRVHRGLVAGAEILRAAGADRIFPLSPRVPELAGARDLERYRGLRAGPRDAVLTSVHPLGTCRMSRQREQGVVGSDHESHDTPGLWIVDASSFPTTPGVNPQLTVMALATRAAEKIHQRLE